MLQRRNSKSGVVWYVSPLLASAGVPHAFSTRLGGVSQGPFESLNLGNPGNCPVQDDPQHIQENYRRLQEAIAAGPRARCWVHQVHGAQVHVAQADSAFDSGVPGDAIVSDDRTRLLAVRTADCVPVLLSRDDGRAVAAVHAGWRGVVGGVVAAAVEALKSAFPGTRPSANLLAAIGPCISAEAYEVGPEVLDAFADAFPGDAPPIQRRVGEKGLVDLREAVRRQLVALGVPARHIDTTDRCTCRHGEEFFSHRRENGITGRMAALIGAR